MENIAANSYLFQLLLPVEKKHCGKCRNHSKSNYQQTVRKSEVNNNIYSSALFATLVLGNMLTCRGMAGMPMYIYVAKPKTKQNFHVSACVWHTHTTQANCKTQLWGYKHFYSAASGFVVLQCPLECCKYNNTGLLQQPATYAFMKTWVVLRGDKGSLIVWHKLAPFNFPICTDLNFKFCGFIQISNISLRLQSVGRQLLRTFRQAFHNPPLLKFLVKPNRITTKLLEVYVIRKVHRKDCIKKL